MKCKPSDENNDLTSKFDTYFLKFCIRCSWIIHIIVQYWLVLSHFKIDKFKKHNPSDTVKNHGLYKLSLKNEDINILGHQKVFYQFKKPISYISRISFILI